MLAIFEPTSSINISNIANGVEVKKGGYLIVGNDKDIKFFSSAPFRPEINPFKSTDNEIVLQKRIVLPLILDRLSVKGLDMLSNQINHS